MPVLDENLQPWWYGYSVGRWEGDELVVETVGFRDDVWLDVQGAPLTGRGKMTERFRRLNYGTLQIDVTIEDPTAYTKPFTVRVNQRLFPDAELIEFICNENEKSLAALRSLSRNLASRRSGFPRIMWVSLEGAFGSPVGERMRLRRSSMSSGWALLACGALAGCGTEPPPPAAAGLGQYQPATLAEAVLLRNATAIENFLALGVDPNEPEADGTTPLMRAVHGEMPMTRPAPHRRRCRRQQSELLRRDGAVHRRASRRSTLPHGCCSRPAPTRTRRCRRRARPF